MSRNLSIDHRAALYDAIADMARIRGQVVLIDRHHDGALVAVGGERQTSDGVDLETAVCLAAHRLGLHADPMPRRDTLPVSVLPDGEDGGLDG
jgi:hypothetical protein